MSSIAQHQVGAITTPVEDDDLDAAVVLGHLQALREGINDHDADPTIHLQSGTTAARPGFGNAGSLYFNTDTGLFEYDTGAAWIALGYSVAGHTHTFASLTSKPTTLAGYGITDAAALVHTHAPADVTGRAVTDGSTLTATSKVPRVTASGVLGPSAVSDDGTTTTNPTQPRARVRSTSTSIPNTDVLTAVAWSVEDLDVGAMVNLGANATRITVSVAGCYLVTAAFSFNGASTARVRYGFGVNGTLTPSDDLQHTGVAGLIPALSLSTVLELTAGQYVELLVAQNGAGSYVLQRGHMSLVKLW